MKRFFAIAAVCLVTLSCSQKKSVLDGTFTPADGQDAQVVAIVADVMTKEADTCAVVDGKFHYECPASDTTMLFVRIAPADENSADRYHLNVSLIPTEGNISVEMSEDTCIVSGSQLTDDYNAFVAEYRGCYNQYAEGLAGISKIFPEGSKEYAEVKEALMEQVQGEMKGVAVKTFKANSQNVVGYQAFTTMMYNLSKDEFDKYLDLSADFIKNNPKVEKIYEAKVNADATAEGKMFVDFEGKDPEGQVARLSDYVGRGNYVLVDFWASWCGPCKREIPNVKELYEKYTDKGLVVLGVAVWDKDNSGSREVMEQLDMKWNQIFAGEDDTPTDVYGIVGIPHIILFAPDGTVLNRGLYGNKMKETVAALFE